MAIKRRNIHFASLVLILTIVTSVIFVLIDALGVPGAGSWGGYVVVAFMASSTLAWVQLRKNDQAGPRAERIAIVVISVALWLAVSFRTFPWVPHDDGTLSLGLIMLLVYFGPDLAKAAWRRLKARGR